MEALVLALLMLAAVLLSSVIDQLVPKVSSPLIQIGLGLLIALFAPSQINITLDPDLFLVLFIAPLLFDEAKNVDKGALWKNRRPVLSLAIGLVVVTALIIGFAVEDGSSPPSACSPPSRSCARPHRCRCRRRKGTDIAPRDKSILEVAHQRRLEASWRSVRPCGGQHVLAAERLARLRREPSPSAWRWGFGQLPRAARALVGPRTRRSRAVRGVHAVHRVPRGQPAGHEASSPWWRRAAIISPRTIGPSISRMNIVSSSVWRVLSFALNGIVACSWAQLPKAMQEPGTT